MASDAYISSYTGNAKTTHINSAASISAKMAYAVWDKRAQAARIICATATDAETELSALAKRRPGNLADDLCVITIPA